MQLDRLTHSHPAMSGRSAVCDDALMRIRCEAEADDGQSGRRGRSVVRIRRLPDGEIDELRAAIHNTRTDGGTNDAEQVVFALERGYSARGRGLARLVVGVGVVVVMFAAVVAFLAPDTAAVALGFVLAPAIVAVALTVLFSATHDTGLTIRSDGTMRSEGWNGIRVVDLASCAEVTVGRGSPTAGGPLVERG